jgi:hypothetical protein
LTSETKTMAFKGRIMPDVKLWWKLSIRAILSIKLNLKTQVTASLIVETGVHINIRLNICRWYVRQYARYKWEATLKSTQLELYEVIAAYVKLQLWKLMANQINIRKMDSATIKLLGARWYTHYATTNQNVDSQEKPYHMMCDLTSQLPRQLVEVLNWISASWSAAS